jgi:7-keto-8-aminopelargonate synthetase-like enzyme
VRKLSQPDAAAGEDARVPSLAPSLQQIDRTFVLAGGRKVTYFGGCDYFRLSSHPAVLAAMSEGVESFGLNVAASRMTTGNHRLYELLEERLAEFFAVETAVLVSSGYVSNLAVAQALAGQFTHALIDDSAHSSLADATRFLDCPVRTFLHRNARDAAAILRRCGPRSRPLLLTDGMFSHNGELAPLQDYLAALPDGGVLWVDDAHAAGVLGATGQGTVELAGLPRRRVIQTITLSKAFGVYGGAVLGSRKLAGQIHARSGLFIGHTPLPLPLASAALTALKVLESDKSLRHRLAQNSRRMKDALRHAAVPVVDSPSPIISVAPTSERDAARLKALLLRHGIFPSFVRYPNGPAEGHFRFALSSEHTQQQLDALAAALVEHQHEARSRP